MVKYRTTYGLCINESFSEGTTGKCQTFENELLTDTEEFKIACVEVRFDIIFR